MKKFFLKTKEFFIRRRYVIITSVMVSVLLLPVITYPLFGSLEVGLSEKRELAKFPDKFSDDFGSKFETYYSDHSPYRNTSIVSFTEVDFALANAYTNVVSYLDPSHYLLYKDRVLIGKDGYLFYYEDYNEIFRTQLYLADTDDFKFNKIQEIADYITNDGKKFSFSVMPNKSSVYEDKLLGSLRKHKGEKHLLEYVQEYYSGNRGIDIKYPKDVLKENMTNEQVYFKYDTHYNDWGSFLSYQLMMEDMNVTPSTYSYSKKVEKFEEDLQQLCGLTLRKENRYKVNYKEDITFVEEEDIPWGEKYEYDHYESANKNGRNLLVIGDSFATSFCRHAVKDFETTNVFHVDDVSKNMEMFLNSNFYASADTVVFVTVERYFVNRFNDKDGTFVKAFEEFRV